MRSSRVLVILGQIGSIIFSLGFYYVLRVVGLGPIWALVGSAVGSGIAAIFVAVQRRRVDALTLLVVFEVLLSIGLTLWVDDPRIGTLRPAIYVGTIGAWFVATCFFGRPTLYTLAAPMATNGGHPDRTKAYELAWTESDRFRHIERVMCFGVGAAMLIDSLARVVIVYSFPRDDIDRSFLMSNSAAIVMVVVIIGFLVLSVRRLTPIVDGFEARVVREREAAEAGRETSSARESV